MMRSVYARMGLVLVLAGSLVAVGQVRAQDGEAGGETAVTEVTGSTDTGSTDTGPVGEPDSTGTADGGTTEFTTLQPAQAEKLIPELADTGAGDESGGDDTTGDDTGSGDSGGDPTFGAKGGNPGGNDESAEKPGAFDHLKGGKLPKDMQDKQKTIDILNKAGDAVNGKAGNPTASPAPTPGFFSGLIWKLFGGVRSGGASGNGLDKALGGGK